MNVVYQSGKYAPEHVAKRYVRVNSLSLPPGQFIVYECAALAKPLHNAVGAGPTLREYVCDADELPTDIAAAAEAKRRAPWPNAVEWPLD